MRIPFKYYMACLALGLMAPACVQAESIVVADDGGYAGKVIEKVGRGWVPPAGLRGHFSVRIKVTVDENGKVSSCKPVESSALKAFDDAACGAVYNAAPFGKTPDGKPVDVHMAFRIGAPKKAKRELTFEEAAREGAKERERLDNLIASQRADFEASRARERAEAAAKKLGIDMPEIKARPMDPTGRPMDEQTGAIATPQGEGKNAPASDGAKADNTTPDTSKPAANKVRPSVGSGGVLIGSSTPKKGPELVIKSNLKHLDAALEAQSEATAEAQSQAVAEAANVVAPQPVSGPRIVVTTPIPAPATPGANGLTDEELAIPPLGALATEIEIVVDKVEQQTGPSLADASDKAPQSKTTPDKSGQDKANTDKADAGKPAANKAEPAKTKADKPAQEQSGTDDTKRGKADVAKTGKPKADTLSAYTPKADTAKADIAKADTSKADTVKADKPKTETAKAETPKADVAKAEKPKVEKPKADTLSAYTPKADTTKTDTSKVDVTKADNPKVEKPKAETVKADTPKTDTAKADTPVVEKTKTATPTVTEPADKEQKAAAAPEKTDATAPAQELSYVDYLERLKQDIVSKIKLPAKLKAGHHVVSVQLYLSRSGRIQRADLIHSNDIRKDEMLAEAVKEVGKVTAPPASLGRNFPLTLILEAK